MAYSDDRSARQERYTIGCQAATVMKSQQVDVRATRDLLDEQFRREKQSDKPIPEVWLRDEKGHARNRLGQIHALRCWIPGTCHSSELLIPWRSLARRPFYALPAQIIQSSLSGQSGYDWGGKICDYWARIDPTKLTDLVLEQFNLLLAEEDQRTFLADLLHRS